MRGEHNGKHAGYQQHQPGGKNEHGKQVRNVLIQPPRVRGRKGIAAGPVLSNGLAGYIMARAEQPVQCAKLSIGAALRGTGQHAGRNGLPQVVFFLPLGAAHHHHAVCVRQKYLPAGGARRNQYLALDILHCFLVPGRGAAARLLQDTDGVVHCGQQVVVIFRAEVAHSQIHLDEPHQRHTAHQQKCRGIEIARGNAFSHRPAPPFPGALCRRMCCRIQSFTSNL